MKNLKTILSVFALAAVFSSAAFAQVSDNIAANAEVTAGLTVTGLTDLEFGTVTRNTPKTVLPSETEAGKFGIGDASNFDISFGTLPTNLVGGTTSANMPISFGTSSASWNTSDNQSGATTFDPNTGLTGLTPGTGVNAGEAYVWLGGTVSPTSSQPADTYTATITLTITNN